MAASPDLITMAQYRLLPDDAGCRYELHYGEVVPASFPKQWQIAIQKLLVSVLQRRVPEFVVISELPFRAVAEFDLRAADVAAVRRPRYEAIDPDDNLLGTPELVIEIKSPSNSKGELQRKATLCLADGAIQFWILERDSRSVTVLRRDGSKRTFGIGGSIPLEAFGGDSLPVAEIFS